MRRVFLALAICILWSQVAIGQWDRMKDVVKTDQGNTYTVSTQDFSSVIMLVAVPTLANEAARLQDVLNVSNSVAALVTTQANLVVSLGNISNDLDTAEATLADLVISTGNISNTVDGLTISLGNVSSDFVVVEAAYTNADNLTVGTVAMARIDPSFAGILNALPTNRPAFAFSSDGTNVTCIVSNSLGNGTLDFFFDGALVSYSVPTNLTLANGATNSIQYNWIYATATSITNSTSFPTGEYALLALVGLLDPARTKAMNGPFVMQRFTDEISGPDSNDRSIIQRLAERIRHEPARWQSGMGVSITTNVNGGADDDLYITMSAGVSYQLHRQTIAAVTNVDGLFEYEVLNDPDVGIGHISNLNVIAKDASGNAVLDGNNSFFNILIVHHVSSGTTNHVDYTLGILLSTDDYSTLDRALKDADGLLVNSVDVETIGSTVPLAMITLRRQAAGGGTWSAFLENRRGQVVGTAGGGGAIGTATTFTDSTFNIVDDADSTKVMKFQASGITTATTRTYTVPDANGTLVISPAVADLDMGGNDITNIGTADVTATNTTGIDGTTIGLTSVVIGDMLRYDGTNWVNTSGVVDRGDNAASDFTTGDLVIDGNYNNLDLSAFVPLGAKEVVLRVFFEDNLVGEILHFRKFGNTNTQNELAGRVLVANVFHELNGAVAIGTNRIIEYRAAAGFDDIRIAVRGSRY